MSRTYAVMWDCRGLEAVARVDDVSKRRMWAVLKGEDANKIPAPNLMHWRLRAQANMQRHYEIYLLETEDDIGEDEIREAFEASPQTMADTVRRIGHPFYSHRRDEQEVRIR